MSKFSSVALGVAVAGMVAVTPAVAGVLLAPTETRASQSLPIGGTAVVTPTTPTTDPRQSSLLVPGGTATVTPTTTTTTDPRQSPLLVPDSAG